MRYNILFLLGLLFFQAQAQHENIRYEDYTYLDDIRTVRLYLSGAPLSLPIIDLNAPLGSMIFEFDLMDDNVKDYWYTIVHCNSDWKPSELDNNEYIKGFSEDRILDFNPSINTLADYVHYNVKLPNRNIGWAVSGNYILKVWEDDGENTLVLTKRFVVTEPQWRVEATLVRPNKVSKQDTHHEIDFKVNVKNARIPNPDHDTKAFVLQNGRWDNCIGPLKPLNMLGDALNYDFQDKVIFPGGKEFRFFDLRRFDARGINVFKVYELENKYEITLTSDESRAGSVYQNYNDLNGRYSIENGHPNQTLIQCDYASVLFSMKQNQPLEDQDVYVFGEMSDWQLKPEFRMQYDEGLKLYYCEPFLKQGYYNYSYAVLDLATNKLDEEGFEGNSYQTVNQYTILVYFRPYGERYDRVMAAATIDSRRL